MGQQTNEPMGTDKLILMLGISALIVFAPAAPFALIFFIILYSLNLDWRIMGVTGIIAFALIGLAGYTAYAEEMKALLEFAVSKLKGEPTAFGLKEYLGYLIPNLTVGYVVAIALSGFMRIYKGDPIRKAQEESLASLYGATKNTVSARDVDRIAREKHPEDGVLLGIDKATKKPVILTNRQLNVHTLILGTPGTGKTTTIMNIVESAAQNKLGCIFIDAKGSKGAIEKIQAIGVKYERPVRVFSLNEGVGETWNPLAKGNTSERRDKVIALFNYSLDFFENMAKDYIYTAFTVWDQIGIRPNLEQFVSALDVAELNRMIRQNNLDIDLSSFNEEHLLGIIKPLQDIGKTLKGKLAPDPDVIGDEPIDLLESIKNGEIVVFSLQIMRYPKFVPVIGRLITLDIKTAAIDLEDHPKMTYVVMDEFGSFANVEVVNVLNQAREFGVCAFLATQELIGDLGVIEKNMVNSVMGNINTIISMRQNGSESASAVSEWMGTRVKTATTYQFNENGATGGGTVTPDTHEYVVHPNTIKNLDMGEAIICTKIQPKFTTEIAVRMVDLDKVGKQKKIFKGA